MDGMQVKEETKETGNKNRWPGTEEKKKEEKEKKKEIKNKKEKKWKKREKSENCNRDQNKREMGR